MPLSPQQFEEHLERCVMSTEEIRLFVEDLALTRLTLIMRELHELSTTATARTELRSETGADWSDASLLSQSGVEADWTVGLADPGSVYLHCSTALRGDWSLVRRYCEAAFLTEKQERVLLPYLRLARRPRVADDLILAGVQQLNRILHRAVSYTVDWETFQLYRAHIRIHGASQNESANVGADGASLAIIDAIEEIAPGRVVDSHGARIPAGIRTPVEVARYRSERPRGSFASLRAILLDNGRAIAFPSDPDIAIFQALGSEQFATARDAWEAFNAVRTARDRASKLHLFAVGEVKTATDSSSLHERSALARRDPDDRTDRFLMMAILPREFLFEEGGGRRRASSFFNRGVRQLAHVFNLYFAWGYDEARRNHPEHWGEFKRQLAEWCGL